ncbi:hypothetical protein HWV62_14222 [Athelia sp. TMB]|nr:hypothetical protein HWV62_14222 [Athelia sp. TMB]
MVDRDIDMRYIGGWVICIKTGQDKEVDDGIENSAMDNGCGDNNGDDDDVRIYGSDGEGECEGDNEDLGPEDGEVEAMDWDH